MRLRTAEQGRLRPSPRYTLTVAGLKVRAKASRLQARQSTRHPTRFFGVRAWHCELNQRRAADEGKLRLRLRFERTAESTNRCAFHLRLLS